MYVTGALGNQHAFLKDAYYLPIRLRTGAKPKSKDDHNGEFTSIIQEATPDDDECDGTIKANLSFCARAYLASLGFANPDADAANSALLCMHTLAIGYSYDYRAENADGIRQDWPRIPLPGTRAALLASAGLGRKVADLLDTETPVDGVTVGKLRPELKTIAVLSSGTSLSLTAGWGHAGKGGVTMPGKGKLVTRSYTADEMPSAEALSQLGASTCDVYLNNSVCWRNIPDNVWSYTIGGYQVLKKWLSYREHGLLGRALTADEAREVTHNARRIAALLQLQPKLDENYAAVKADAAPWSDSTTGK
jgi:hypothetical protein